MNPMVVSEGLDRFTASYVTVGFVLGLWIWVEALRRPDAVKAVSGMDHRQAAWQMLMFMVVGWPILMAILLTDEDWKNKK